jgi:glycosidase
MLNNKKVLDYLSVANIYEVNLRQYTHEGTIAAFMEHLPRLKEMGVAILWFMPLHPIGKINRKGSLGSYYSSSNFFELNPEFGTASDFKNMVNVIHELGMKVIIDWVANHAAWDNNWAITNPDFFVRAETGQFLSPYDWTDVIQIDHNNEAAHDAMRTAMCYWVREFDIDGFRADLAHLTPLRFWIKARQVTESIKPDLIWLAETEDPDFYQAFDIVYAWRWMHKTESYFKNSWGLDALHEVLNEEKRIYPENARQLFFTTNHDENSWNGTEFEKYGIYAKALAVFSFFYPSSVPLIYSGQEIPNYKRLQFFDKDELDWKGDLQLHEFYKVLIEQRKKISVDAEILFISNDKKLLAFKINSQQNILLVFLNLDSSTISVNYENHEAFSFENIFNTTEVINQSLIQFDLLPGDFKVLNRI